ncbi:MAG: hypothetical protein ACHQ50_03750 [Fimbriimonadales bacterium]
MPRLKVVFPWTVAVVSTALAMIQWYFVSQDGFMGPWRDIWACGFAIAFAGIMWWKEDAILRMVEGQLDELGRHRPGGPRAP